MARVNVLLEFDVPQKEAFGMFTVAATSPSEAVGQATPLLDRVAGYGVELEDSYPPVPMFSEPQGRPRLGALDAFSDSETGPDLTSATTVLPATVDADRVDQMRDQPGVRVWTNSDLTLLAGVTPVESGSEGLSSQVDCRPFQPAATIDELRQLLDVERVWQAGFRGRGVAVAIIDEGVHGDQANGTYPVVDGFDHPNSLRFGEAPITSHGSMCAADVLIAAPDAVIYDYPFLDQPRSGDAIAMFQAVLDHRRLDGTPHLTNNSWGFSSVPPQALLPNHEIWNLNHPLHRKIREVIVSGAPTFFSAGNCGRDCPSGSCDASSIGPGKSIHGSNSLAEVITIAAVNRRHARIGYSSQGPGMFEREKPDLSAYSHVFGNFGPGRPGGTHSAFDNGTSAACPVAAGVGALLLSAFPDTTPTALRDALVQGAIGGLDRWSPDFGRGVVNAGAAFDVLNGS